MTTLLQEGSQLTWGFSSEVCNDSGQVCSDSIGDSVSESPRIPTFLRPPASISLWGFCMLVSVTIDDGLVKEFA